jgi:hypothetical protein
MRFDRRWFGMAFGLVGLMLLPAFGDDKGSSTAGNTIDLKGEVQGTYTVRRPNPDTGSTYELSGQGRVQPLGGSEVNGSFQTPGNITNGHAEGTLTLTGAQGGVTLQLVGPTQAAFAPPPAQFTFTITGGTGKFQGVTGSGTAALALRAAPPAAGGATQPAGGAFTLTFGPAAPTAGGSIKVEITGVLHRGVLAPGGETTGTTIPVQGINWELDLGQNPEFAALATQLNGKVAVARGPLQVRPGVAVRLRYIITVTSLAPGSPE